MKQPEQSIEQLANQEYKWGFVSDIESDWVDALLPDKLVTLTFLPGIEYQYPVTVTIHAAEKRGFGHGPQVYPIENKGGGNTCIF